MNRKDILAKSRKKDLNQDLYAQSIGANASAISSFVSLLLATLFFVLQSLINKEFRYGLYALVLSYAAVNYIVRAVAMKRTKDMVLALVALLASVVFSLRFVYLLLTTANG